MSDNVATPTWNTLIQQLTSPWDWCFLIAGGSIGFVTSYFAGGESGTIAAASGGIAIALRRAFVASFKGRWLKYRARKLITWLECAAQATLPRSTDHPEVSAYRWFYDSGDCTTVLALVERDLNLFEVGITTKDQFEDSLNEHIGAVQKAHLRQKVVGAPATAASEVNPDDEIAEYEAFQRQWELGDDPKIPKPK